ncbi:hypothetical protein BDC45DRAFT_519934 [Circinella umbellata]|nr:hypothetical protein BDC45DRAFT_519934 [Circinella umbellata]
MRRFLLLTFCFTDHFIPVILLSLLENNKKRTALYVHVYSSVSECVYISFFFRKRSVTCH